MLATNSLQWLEELEIRSSELLTMKTVRCKIIEISIITGNLPPCSSLLLHCDHLVSLLDLSGWTQVEEADLAELRQHMKENNVNLRLTESNERDSR